MAAHRVGKAVDDGLGGGAGGRAEPFHPLCAEKPREGIAVFLIAPILQQVLVVFRTQGNLEIGAVAGAEEERHAGHPRQVELLIPLDDGGGEQIVDTDPIADLVGIDKVAEEGIKGGLFAGAHQSQPVFPLFALFAEDLIADRLVQHRIGGVPLQSGKEDLHLGAGVIVRQIGNRDPHATQREIGTLGEQLLPVLKLDQHRRAEVHPLLTAAVVAGKGNGVDIILPEGAGRRRQLTIHAGVVVLFLPLLQRLVDTEGIDIAVEIALGLEQGNRIGGHEVSDAVELMHQALILQLIAHVDDPAAGGALALELHLDQKTAVAVFLLSHAVEDLLEIFLPQQGDELFNQMLLVF